MVWKYFLVSLAFGHMAFSVAKPNAVKVKILNILESTHPRFHLIDAELEGDTILIASERLAESKSCKNQIKGGQSYKMELIPARYLIPLDSFPIRINPAERLYIDGNLAYAKKGLFRTENLRGLCYVRKP